MLTPDRSERRGRQQTRSLTNLAPLPFHRAPCLHHAMGCTDDGHDGVDVPATPQSLESRVACAWGPWLDCFHARTRHIPGTARGSHLARPPTRPARAAGPARRVAHRGSLNRRQWLAQYCSSRSGSTGTQHEQPPTAVRRSPCARRGRHRVGCTRCRCRSCSAFFRFSRFFR